ncbi:MAG: hypothetical protein ACREDP_23875, partial [Bradyrhizobium sp.]
MQAHNQHDRDFTASRRLLQCDLANVCTTAKVRHDNKRRIGEDAVVINRLFGSAFIGLGLLLAAQAYAQSPPKTVTLVVPYAAGGGTDTVARLIGE